MEKEKNKIYLFFGIVTAMFILGCNQIQKNSSKCDLYAQITEISYSPLSQNISVHNFPVVYIKVKVKNFSSETISLSLDSIRNGEKYSNFILILEKNKVPFIENVEFDNIHIYSKSIAESPKEGGITLAEETIKLEVNDSIDITFKYSKFEMSNVLQEYGNDSTEFENNYMKYLKQLFSSKQLFLAFKPISYPIIAKKD